MVLEMKKKAFLFLVYVLIAFPVSPLVLAVVAWVAAWFYTQ